MSHSNGLVRKRHNAPSTSSFFISESSPLIHYSTLSNGSSAWQAGYALQNDGYDETLHLTSSGDAQFSFNVSASSLTFLVPSFENCAATVSINDSTPVAACSTKSASGDLPFALSNLPVGRHKVTWSAGQVANQQQVVFWGIDGTRPGAPAGHTNLTIDDTFSGTGPVAIKYGGAWDHLSEGSGGKDTSVNFNKTLAVTRTQGAQVSFSGQGSAVYLYGSVGPDYSSASVSLNGQIVAPNMNLTSPWDMSYQLLWFCTGLDPTTRSEITLTNLQSSTMSLNFVILTAGSDVVSQLAPAAPTSFLSTLAGKLVVFLVVPVIVLLAVGLLILYICSPRRRMRQRRRADAEGVVTTYAEPKTPGITKPESRWSSTSSPSVQEVFVSYDEARSQRMSDRWNSPNSPPSGHTFGSPSRSSQSGSQRTRIPVPTLPESAGSTPTDDETSTGASWSRPLRSIFGNSLLATPNPRRQTELPAYSPEDTTTYASSHSASPEREPKETSAGPSVWPSAAAEKSQLSINDGGRAGPSRQSASTSRDRHASTVAPSSIYSVFGAPPSVRHPSMSTTYHPDLDSPALPAIPTRPTVITDILKHTPSFESASTAAHSAMPLLGHSPLSDNSPKRPLPRPPALTPPSAFSRNIDEDWPVPESTAEHAVRRNGSTAWLTVDTSASAVNVTKPESAVMPYSGSSLSTRL